MIGIYTLLPFKRQAINNHCTLFALVTKMLCWFLKAIKMSLYKPPHPPPKVKQSVTIASMAVYAVSIKA